MTGIRCFISTRQEKLAEDATELRQLQEKHFTHFLALAEKAKPLLDGPEQNVWLERLERDHDNFRTALTYALSCDSSERALSLSGELRGFWHIRGYYTEGREWLERSLAQPDSSPTQARAAALLGVGWTTARQGDYELAKSYLTESLAIYRELNQPQNIAGALGNLGGISFYTGDYDIATSYYEEVLTIFQSLKSQRDIAKTLNNLGALAFVKGDLKKASSFYTKGLQIFQKMGDKTGIAKCLSDVGIVAMQLGNYGSARDFLNRSLAVSQELGHKANSATVFSNLGTLERREGNYDQAHANYVQGLRLWQALGHQVFLFANLEDCAILFIKQKEGRRAACLMGAVESFRETTGISRQPHDQLEFEQVCSELTKQLSEDGFASAKAEGRKMTLEQAITYALSGVPDKAQ